MGEVPARAGTETAQEKRQWIEDWFPKVIGVGPVVSVPQSLVAEAPEFFSIEDQPECTCVYCHKRSTPHQSILEHG